MEYNIFDLNKQLEEVKKIEEYLTRQFQEKIEICQQQELKILSLKEYLDKTTTQLKKNSKIKNNIEESKISIVKEEKTNNNTCSLRSSHDNQESREVTTQRYPTRVHGHYYKCNNYGHKSIHCRARDIITLERNQSTFLSQCYNCYHYGHLAKHCKMQGQVKVWRGKQVQSNDMNNHHPTKVWRFKLVDCTIDHNRNDENLGKNPITF